MPYTLLSYFLALLFMFIGCPEEAMAYSYKDNVASTANAFGKPNDETKTRLWWFHGETPTTCEGITADLEAFSAQGIGGIVYYDQVHGNADGALPAFSDEWWQMLCYSASEAKRLGLTFDVHVSNGFVAGGPWITPDLSMRRLVCRDTVVSADGGAMSLRLPEIACRVGTPHDVAVMAYKIPESCYDALVTSPIYSCNIESLSAADFFQQQTRLPSIPFHDKNERIWLMADYGHEVTICSITYETRPRGKATTSATNVPGEPGDVFVGTGYRTLPALGELQCSDDGIHFTDICQLRPVYRAHGGWRQTTVAFPPVKARYFRIMLHGWQEANEKSAALQIGCIALLPYPTIDRWQEKAGLVSEYSLPSATPPYDETLTVRHDDLILLDSMVTDDGVLCWKPAAGRWRVMRFAHVSTGARTKHGRKNLMGLECDKMSSKAAEVQWDNYFARIADTLAYYQLPLDGMAMDSHEAGSQNWTPLMLEKFMSLRGYDLLHFLPVMAGCVVDSKEISEAVLYDVRRTIADLISEEYYGTLQELCSGRGVTFTAQATGNALCIVADPLQAKGRVDKPQGEFWAIHPDGNYDIKESSSAAHVYGKKIASAEAFTDAKYSQPLSYMKQLADYAYCFGINEFVVCASAYQPWLDRQPGNTAGGRHYCLNRNNTYWPVSKPFWDYQTRVAAVMRQGRSVCDVALYLGDDAPMKILTYRLPRIPPGYDFDAMTTDGLVGRICIEDGLLSTPDGIKYRLLELSRGCTIPLRALRHIAALVNDGAVVHGDRPSELPPSYADMAQSSEYKDLVRELWGDSVMAMGDRRVGKGSVIWGNDLCDALSLIDLKPDVLMPASDTLYYAHRSLTDGEVYFLDNRNGHDVSHDFVFRTERKAAEWWDVTSGQRFRLPLNTSAEGTSVHLDLAARESGIVVLHDDADASKGLPQLPQRQNACTMTLDDEWNVNFPMPDKNPHVVTMPVLYDWTTSADSVVRYFSGTASYEKTVTLTGRMLRNKRVMLSVDQRNIVAELFINGMYHSTLWCSPWTADITDLLRKGENRICLRVTNSLANRMIGDAALPEPDRTTWATTPLYSPTDNLVESGLTGVRLEFIREE